MKGLINEFDNKYLYLMNCCDIMVHLYCIFNMGQRRCTTKKCVKCWTILGEKEMKHIINLGLIYKPFDIKNRQNIQKYKKYKKKYLNLPNISIANKSYNIFDIKGINNTQLIRNFENETSEEVLYFTLQQMNKKKILLNQIIKINDKIGTIIQIITNNKYRILYQNSNFIKSEILNLNLKNSKLTKSQIKLGFKIKNNKLIQYCSIPCYNCGLSNDDSKLLLCDNITNNCNKGCHIYCLKTPLNYIPKKDWFCNFCLNTKEKNKRKRKLQKKDIKENKKKKRRLNNYS